MATDVIVPPEQPNASMRCSFCKKTRAQVFKIVLGPNVSICDECVELCEEILAEERLKVKSSARRLHLSWLLRAKFTATSTTT